MQKISIPHSNPEPLSYDEWGKNGTIFIEQTASVIRDGLWRDWGFSSFADCRNQASYDFGWSKSVRAAIAAVESLPAIEAKAKERQVESGKNYGEGHPQEVPAKLQEPLERPESTQIAGDLFGVSGRYVAEAKKLKKDDPELFQQVLNGDVTLQEAKKEHDILQDVLLSSETNEWYTPKEYADLARAVMGSIDLDPASCTFANDNYIKAKSYYTIDDNGLSRPWHGSVWLNPPYGKTGNDSNQAIWVDRAIQEVLDGNTAQAIVLLKAAIGYDWFDSLVTEYPMCFKVGLIEFIKPDGTVSGKAKLGTAFLYLSMDNSRLRKFREVFSSIGWFNE